MEATTENKPKLTKEQLKHIAAYLLMFKNAYYFITHKQLATTEELVNLVLSDKITFEDVFMVYIDKKFDQYADNDDEDFWERNMEIFDCENYFPEENKNVNDGAWIKIRTENGFEVHYAKKSSRKRRYDEEYAELAKQHSKLIETATDKLNKALSGINEMTSEELKSHPNFGNDKIKAVAERMKELAVRIVIALPVYEVKISRTKHVLEYYLPHQYEIVTDIDEFSDAYVQSVPGVGIKSLYSSQNADAIFYLQSRGISKKVAEMMATLKQTYFKVDMHTAMKAYDEILKSRIKFVKSVK